LRIAYLVNQYPQTSQSFIRREIEALEAAGQAVARYTVRAVEEPLVDDGDRLEREKTRVILGVGKWGLLKSTARAAMGRPAAWARAARLAMTMGRRSERGLAVHLAYLAEACVLREWAAEAGVDHIHAHFGTNSTAVAALCRALGGPPFSFTVHGPEEFDGPRSLCLREKARLAAFVVAISHFTRSQIFRWADHADWPKVHVVRCGLDPSYLDGPAPGPPPSTNRLACVGRLAEQKGQLLLVEAVGRLRDRGVDCEVVLVGDGPMRGEIERAIAALGLGDRVRLVGWMSKAEVRRELIGARALVMASFAEGLPVALMEALALGRPVVTTNVAGIPELVEDGECGWLIPPGSVDDLAGAMASALAAPPAELERMGRVGAARALARHNAATEAGKLATLFHARADGEATAPAAAVPPRSRTAPPAHAARPPAAEHA